MEKNATNINTKKKMPIRMKCFICVALILVVGAIFVVSFYNNLDTFGENTVGEKYYSLEKKDDLYAEFKYAFTVKKGDTINSVANRLAEVGIIKYPEIFKLVAKKNGMESILKEGVFHVNWKDSYFNILKTFDGRPEYMKVTIPEHYDFRQTANRLKELNLINDVNEFISIANNYISDYWFETEMSIGEKYKYEGYFFPATYEVDLNSTPEAIVKMFLQGFALNCNSILKDATYPVGLTYDEVITLASIVEREAGNVQEFPRVAGVFINRLKIDMKLESCATLKYIFENDDDPNTVAKDQFSGADTKVDSPYNTYKNFGLPPGAICSPSVAAIKAVMNYEQHDYLYFVATGDNSNYFSRTYQEHAAAVAKYLG